jgi:hypothetical protein
MPLWKRPKADGSWLDATCHKVTYRTGGFERPRKLDAIGKFGSRAITRRPHKF